MQQNNTKSSVTAGILGVFLGAFGGHDWYLGNTKKAIAHVALCVGGLLLLMVGVILMSISDNIPLLRTLFVCLVVAAYVIIIGNGVWGFIEGVVIIAQGDAGLAAKGYKVAAQATTTMQTNTPVVAADDAKLTSDNSATNVVQSDVNAEEKSPLANILTATPASDSIMPNTVTMNTQNSVVTEVKAPESNLAPVAAPETKLVEPSSTTATPATPETSLESNPVAPAAAPTGTEPSTPTISATPATQAAPVAQVSPVADATPVAEPKPAESDANPAPVAAPTATPADNSVSEATSAPNPVASNPIAPNPANTPATPADAPKV